MKRVASETNVKFLIIGAGPCGLGAACRLKELAEFDFLILEQQPWVGGLASSFVDEKGFTWDIGGHVQFSHYKYFDQLMDNALGKDGWFEHERESWVWIKDRFVPYPFQNNVRYLPREIAWRCLKGAIEVSKNPAKELPKNFREWIFAVFGEGIAHEFMLPYNFKVWGYDPAEMAYQWIGERVSVVDVARMAENIILEKDDVSWGPNNKFRFPKHGGTGAIWRSVGDKIGLDKIRVSSTVKRISPKANKVVLEDGTTINYQRLLSTLPINVLAQLIDDIPPVLRRRAGELKFSSTNIIGVGLEGQPKAALATKCWMYFPEDNCPFYRVTLFSKYSRYNVPDISRHFSLMTETSESAKKPVDRARLVEKTIEGLRNTALIGENDRVVSTWIYHAPYGYPTPSLERDAILWDVIPAFEELGVYSRGRFGGWKYEVSNQDHTCMQGVEWVNLMVQQEPETTYRLS